MKTDLKREVSLAKLRTILGQPVADAPTAGSWVG
jgi:hypothetical protein